MLSCVSDHCISAGQDDCKYRQSIQLVDRINATDGVVRVGSTVRKPWTVVTPSVLAYKKALRDAGVDVPVSYGQDTRGRHITDFVPGSRAMDSFRLSLSELSKIGRLVRAIHDASASYEPTAKSSWIPLIPTPNADLIWHNVLAPWNLIIGERWVFIDWDAAAPSTRLWDLAYAAQTFTLYDASAVPSEAARALAAFIDGYDADKELRALLPAAIGTERPRMW